MDFSRRHVTIPRLEKSRFSLMTSRLFAPSFAAKAAKRRRSAMRTALTMTVAVSAGFWLAQPAQADDATLGKVNFETSCKAEAQQLFNKAMLYQHSFWYRASQRTYEEVLKADPECGIAYWGIALSLLWNPHVAPPAKNLAEGAAAIAKGKSLSAKTARERDYLDALAVMYADFDKVDHRTRIVAYAKAMEQLAERSCPW